MQEFETTQLRLSTPSLMHI